MVVVVVVGGVAEDCISNADPVLVVNSSPPDLDRVAGSRGEE